MSTPVPMRQSSTRFTGNQDSSADLTAACSSVRKLKIVDLVEFVGAVELLGEVEVEPTFRVCGGVIARFHLALSAR